MTAAKRDRPTAITGTWSDLERQAEYVYFDEGVPNTTLYELAEAVLVLLVRIREGVGMTSAATMCLISTESEPVICDGGCGLAACPKASAAAERFDSAHPELRSTPAELVGTEGFVTVWDHEGRYVGCMGADLWRMLLTVEAERRG